MPEGLSPLLMAGAVGNRHGLVLQPQQAKLSMADVEGIVHYGVPRVVDTPWESAAGGVAWNERDARLAAIGEAIERSTSAQAILPMRPRRSIPVGERIDAAEFALFTPEQRADPGFPHGSLFDDECPYVVAHDLQDNSSWWVPQPFVTLQDPHRTGMPTSSGLAAAPTAREALLRGLLELIERDALMTTWLHGLAGRAVAASKQHLREVSRLGGEFTLFDLTPAYSPFPVAAVMGGIPKRGTWRYSLGVACRTSWEAAAEKAFLEWNQGVLFAGIYGDFVDVSGLTEYHQVRSFDQHAMFYTRNPEHWPRLPILQHDGTLHPAPVREPGPDLLEAARQSLARAGIRVLYRDITTIDAVQAGLYVVKALSPDMASIYAHEDWPLCGGVEEMLPSRYPDRVQESAFPNRMPHPLG
ncbi:MAG: YcaO-like family protein [Propionibacteriaceae bacterium]|nr:YcaO-like family protein [Propionibacteriaceae bacterium]